MKKIREAWTMLVLALGALLTGALTGCDGGGGVDTQGVNDYFAANPVVSDPRLPSAPSDVTVTPTSGNIANIGDVLVFTVHGGEKPWTWGAANDNGTVQNLGEKGEQGQYTATVIGPNTVIVYDSNGHAALAEVTVSSSALAITPASGTLTTNGATATFIASGGLPPYTWTLLNGNGSLSVSTGTSVVYTRNLPGGNSLTVMDGTGITTYTVPIYQP